MLTVRSDTNHCKKQIAALCVAKNSSYKALGLECYDQKRNARNYTGNLPVICHPPCRGYSTHWRHAAKPPPGEKDLALFCAEQITRVGGVMEHPAHSHFYQDYGFADSKDWKITKVKQSWWGYPTQKRTWLLTPRCYKIPEYPFNLEQQGNERYIFDQMSSTMRSHTTRAFALFLISIVELNNETS